MKYLFKLFLFAAISLVILGCNKTPTPMYPNWPIVIDNSLQNKIEITNSISRQRRDGLAEVQFGIKNRLNENSLDFLYHVQWFDKDGFNIKSITDTFVPVHLGPGEEKTLSVIATSPKVVTYKIFIVDYDKNKERIKNETNQYR